MTDALEQYNNHVIHHLLAQAEHELKHNTNRGPDEYYDCKARVLRLRAAVVGKRHGEIDPVAFHYGFQSN